MSDNLKKVYSTLQREGYELPKYEEFEADMRDDKLLGEVRQTLVNAGYTPPEFNDFKFDMWGTTPAPADKSQYTFTSEQLGLEPEEDDMRSMTVERQTSMPTPMWGTISVGENRREAVKDLGSASSGQGGISEYIEMLSGVKSEGQEKAEEQMRIAKERAARGERNWHPYGDTKKPLIESPDIRIGAADNVGLGSPYFNADIYADEAVRRAEEGLKPADAWTEATKRAQANIANKNRQAQIKKAAEDAVGEQRERLTVISDRLADADAKRPPVVVGNPTTMGGVLTKQRAFEKDYRELRAADNLLSQTEKMVETFNAGKELGGWANLGRSMATTVFDPTTWDFGFTDANVAERLLSVVEKADKGEKLSESEQLLLDAAINHQVMQGYYGELSGWQKAGQMFGESLPFMAQMAINPMASLGKYASSKAAKAVVKHIAKKVGEKGIKKILAKTAGITGRALGDLAGSYGVALTTNLGNTTADALNRQIGDIQYDYDDNGIALYNGRLNVKEAGEAWLDAANNQAFEFYSEQMGDYFAPILKGMGKLGGKALKNFGMDGVNRWVSDFAKKGSVRQLNQFFDKTQFHGFASEYAEEIANGMLNAAFVGDMTMEDVFSKDNLIDTAIGLSVMGAIGPMVGTAGYARAKYKEKQALNAADEEGRRLMGHAWDYFADAVRRSKNGKELSTNLRETLNSFGRKALPGEDMRQILSYAQAYNRYKAVEEVSAAAVAEGVMDERDLELQRQYENGQTTTDKHGLRVTFEAAADAVKDVIPLNIGENTAYDIADEYDEQGDTDTATAIRVFLSARAAHSGMTAQIREQAQSELESANAEIDSHTNKTDGNIYSVTLGGGLNGYVTGGTVITDSDGDIDIDATREANEGGYIYVNVDGVVKPKSVDDFVSLDGVESAADAKVAREAEINAALNAEYEALTAPVETQEAAPASTEVTPESAAPAETAAAPVNNTPTVSNEVAENAARALGVLPEELEEVILDEQEGLERAARYNNIGDTDSADAIRAYVAERFGTPAVQPAQVNNATAAEVGNNGAENIPTEQAPENVAPAIPVEKRGKEERQAFHLVPVERTTEELYNSGLDQQEIDAFVQANIDEINSDIEKHSKKQPKMGANIAAYKAAKEEWQAQNEDLAARLNYYKGLQEHIKGITTSNTAEAINDPIADVSDITTPEEFIAAQLGGIKITPESFRKETGLSATEQKALVGVIAGEDKGGVSIERAAEIITDNYSEELAGLGFKGDMMDVRNAIIDILSGGNPKTYAKRAAEARQMQVVDERRDQMDYIARQLGFDSVDDMIAYEETLLPRIFEQYAGFDEQTYYSILVNDYNDYDTTRESETVGRGGEVLQDEQPTNASGTKPVGTGQQGGTATSSVQSNGANVATPGNQEASEPVGNSEQLNQSGDNTEMGAEGDAPGQSNVIAELSEPTQSVTASDVSKPQVPEEGGRELLNAETATTSADESTASVSNSQENDDIRFRSVGGNSGYVGYSMSKRAAEAREEGRFPKTDFKKEYDMPQQTLDALVEAGIIDNSEWHHTSKIGNRTTFYGWTDEAFADIYAENKKEIDAMVKDVNANIAELEKEEKDFLDSWKGYQYPESFDWNAYRRRAHEMEDLPYNERMDILRSEFPETAEKEKHDSRQQEFSREIDNRKREQRKRINELFTKNVNYIVSLFNRENAGAAPCVVIKNIDTLEAQLKEAGFSNESIEDSKEGLRDGYLAGYDPNEDYVVIYDSNASEYEIIGYLWHENAHKEIGKVYTQEEIDNAFHFYFKNNIDKVYELLKDYPESLVHEEALIKAFEKDYQHTLDVIDGNDTETREKRMSFIEFFRPIVNNIRYGERENTTGEQQGAKSVRPDNVGELEVRNSETQRETERREERIQKVNSEIISAVNKLAAELHTDVEIVKEVSAIPDARKRGSKGWYDGRVHLVLPNTTSVDDAVATVLHEVVGHKGLRALFGERFNGMLADVFKNAPKQIRKAILDRALKMMAEGRKNFLHVATEEYLAEQAERGFDDYSFLDKAKGWILKLLRSIGLKSKISDSEIRYMLWRNYNLLKSNNALAEIENIAMQARLGVGEYRARGEVIDANHRDTSNAQEQYNKNVEGFTDRVKEAWIDKTRSVKKMQEAIEKETGNKIADYANVYLLMNQMPGRVREKMDKFLKKHLDPLGEFLKEMFKNNYLKGSEEQKQKQVERYLNCKHGIERNIDMSVRAALTNEEGILDRKTYEQYTTEKEAIWEKNLPWAEEVKELTELSKKYNAKEKDYSGLTALFPSEDSYKKIRSKAIKRVEDFENAFDKKVIDELWKRVGDINELTLKESYKSGLLSNDLYRSIKRQFKYYVPLRGFEETTADEVYEYLSREDVPISGPIRRAEGRKSEAEKIFATMANMYNSAVSMGAKNRIKQALFQMAVMNKTSLLSVNPSYYKEDGRGGYEPFLPSITDNMSEDEIREEMEKYEEDVKKGLKDGTIRRHREGLNIDYKSEKWQRDEHAVRVKRNGTEFVVFVNGSPRVAQAINGLLDKRGGKFIQTLQAANRWRARNITGYNVNFTLSNLARDIQEATITAFAKEGFAYTRKFEKELMKNLAAFRAEDGVKYRGIHNLYYRYFKDELDLTDKREKYFKEFMENGGETGFHSMMSIEDYQKRIKKAVDSNLLNATGKGLAAINDTVEFVNRGIENACRFATYVASRESGKSIMQSVNDAKEASVNFNRVGSGAMGNLYFRASKMFLNPAIQGLVKRLTLMRYYPARMVPIVAMEFLTGYIVGDLAMMAMKFIWDALGFDDDDEENNAYYNLSDFVRRSNVIIPLVDGKFMKIPLSHESRVAHGIGEMISSYMNGHLDYENIPAQSYAVLTQSIPLNPTAPDSFTDENLLEDIAKVLIPDAFALPAYEALALNRDFTGRRITGRSDYNEHRPEYMRAGKGTPEFFIEMSRTINDWTGGSDIERGVLENAVGGVNNPTFYEYMLIANLGGIATMTAQLYKTAQALKGDEEYQEARNYPVINRFFEDTSSYEEKPQERTRRDYERAYRFFKEKVKDYSDVLNNYKSAENMGIDGLEDELEDIKGEKMEEKRDAFKPYKQDLDELYDDLNEAKDKKDQSKIKEIEKDILEKKIEAVKEMEKEFSWE